MAIDTTEVTTPQPNTQEPESAFGELKKRYAKVRPHVRRALHDVTKPAEISAQRRSAFIAADSVMQEVEPIIAKSKIDELTQLPNYGSFREILEIEIEAAKMSGENLMAMFIDLNKFKKINSLLLHEGANELLKEFAQLIAKATRPMDIAARPMNDEPAVNGNAARYGGDEFIILLRGSGTNGPQAVFTRLKEGLKSLPRRQDLLSKGFDLTISAGVSQIDLDNPNESLKLADSALYEAKNKSKRSHNANKLVIA